MAEIIENDENCIPVHSRKPLEIIKQNTLKSRRQSSIGLDDNVIKSRRQSSVIVDADNCSKRLKVLLAEKEKNLTFLEKELTLSQSKVEELQITSERHKRNALEAKKGLATHESNLKRQTVTLKYTNDRLHALVRKEDDKIRRSSMQKKELEDELERTEEEHEEQIASINESNRAECATLEGLLSSLKLQQSIQLKTQSDGFDISTIDLANQYTQDISAFKESMTDIEAQSTHLLNENKGLQSRVNKVKLEFESQCRENSDLVSFNEKVNHQFKRQTTELEVANEQNTRLQCFVDNLLFEKRNSETAELDKDTKTDEVMKLLDEKNRRLTEANLEKSQALKFASAECVRLSKESELHTRSFTELWSSKEEINISGNDLKSQIHKLNTNLSRAHEKINTNVSKIDGLEEIIVNLNHDVSLSNRKISELEETSVLLEGKVLISQSEVNMITIKYDNLEVEHSKLDSSHDVLNSQLVEERIAKNFVDEELKKEQNIGLSRNHEHKEALKKEENNANMLMKTLEEKKTDMISLESNLHLVKEELLASHANVEKILIQEENNKNILGAFKLRLKDTKSSLEISQNDNLIAINNHNAIKEELIVEITSYKEQLAANLSLLAAADETKIRLLEEIAVLGTEISTASIKLSQLQEDIDILTGVLGDKEEDIINISEDSNNLSKALVLKCAEVEKSLLLQQIAAFASDEEAKKMDLRTQEYEEEIRIAQQQAMGEKELNVLAQNMALATAEAFREETASYQVKIVTLEKDIGSCKLSLTESQSNNKALVEDIIVLESTRDGMSLSLIETEGAYAALLEIKNTLTLEISEETHKVARKEEELTTMTAAIQQYEISMADLEAINMSSEVAIISLNEEISKKEKEASLADGEALELKKHLVDLSDKVVSTAEKLEIIVNEKGRLKVELKGSIEEFRKMKLMHMELEMLVEKQKGEKVSMLGDLKDHRMKATITVNEAKRRNEELSSKNEELDNIMEIKSKHNSQLEKELAESVEKATSLESRVRKAENEMKMIQKRRDDENDEQKFVKRTEYLALQDTHRAAVNELSKTRIDFAKLTEEMALTIGHTNTKQKIHHLQQMKQQIQNLVEENQRLRDAATVSGDQKEASAVVHGKKSFVV